MIIFLLRRASQKTSSRRWYLTHIKILSWRLFFGGDRNIADLVLIRESSYTRSWISQFISVMAKRARVFFDSVHLMNWHCSGRTGINQGIVGVNLGKNLQAVLSFLSILIDSPISLSLFSTSMRLELLRWRTYCLTTLKLGLLLAQVWEICLRLILSLVWISLVVCGKRCHLSDWLRIWRRIHLHLGKVCLRFFPQMVLLGGQRGLWVRSELSELGRSFVARVGVRWGIFKDTDSKGAQRFTNCWRTAPVNGAQLINDTFARILWLSYDLLSILSIFSDSRIKYLALNLVLVACMVASSQWRIIRFYMDSCRLEGLFSRLDRNYGLILKEGLLPKIIFFFKPCWVAPKIRHVSVEGIWSASEWAVIHLFSRAFSL